MAAYTTQLAATPEVPAEAAEPPPAHEEIALLAYALWQERGSPEGSSEEDWLNAERQLLARLEE
jgi:hypothetical protein